MGQPTPLPLSDVISRLIDFKRKNATVDSFRNLLQGPYQEYADCTQTITAFLNKLKMHRFISLIRPTDRAEIAIVLNAGNGIVAKITTPRFLRPEDEMMPGRLPPIHRFPPVGQSEKLPYIVEIFPWVRRDCITDADLESMKKALDEYGVCFKEGDDRKDNVGKLPTGRLVVLDGAALKVKEGCTLKPEALDDWLAKVHRDMGQIYSPAIYNHEIPLMHDTPDFSEKYSPLAVTTAETKKHSDLTLGARPSFGQTVKNGLGRIIGHNGH